jgi:hypothetical protein
MKSIIKQSLFLGFFSSLYFIQEISENVTNPFFRIFSLTIQTLHDAVCILFVILFFRTCYYRSNYYLLNLNMLHCIVMMLFCYYKRCVLTLLYNHTLGLDSCVRYIPIWQRLYNWLYVGETVCATDTYHNTYLWLNNHIFQSFIVFLTNLYIYCFGKNFKQF